MRSRSLIGGLCRPATIVLCLAVLFPYPASAAVGVVLLEEFGKAIAGYVAGKSFDKYVLKDGEDILVQLNQTVDLQLRALQRQRRTQIHTESQVELLDSRIAAFERSGRKLSRDIDWLREAQRRQYRDAQDDIAFLTALYRTLEADTLEASRRLAQTERDVRALEADYRALQGRTDRLEVAISKNVADLTAFEERVEHEIAAVREVVFPSPIPFADGWRVAVECGMATLDSSDRHVATLLLLSGGPTYRNGLNMFQVLLSAGGSVRGEPVLAYRAAGLTAKYFHTVSAEDDAVGIGIIESFTYLDHSSSFPGLSGRYLDVMAAGDITTWNSSKRSGWHAEGAIGWSRADLRKSEYWNNSSERRTSDGVAFTANIEWLHRTDEVGLWSLRLKYSARYDLTDFSDVYTDDAVMPSSGTSIGLFLYFEGQ